MRLLSLTPLLLIASVGPPAKIHGEQPAKYEYAELQCRRHARAPVPQPGMKGLGPPVRVVEIRWVTADDEVTATEWADLAEKLKTPAPKKEASVLMHRLRVFRQLGEQGWEVTEHTGDDGTETTSTWTFRRPIR